MDSGVFKQFSAAERAKRESRAEFFTSSSMNTIRSQRRTPKVPHLARLRVKTELDEELSWARGLGTEGQMWRHSIANTPRGEGLCSSADGF
jgi:hypothetical protein